MESAGLNFKCGRGPANDIPIGGDLNGGGCFHRDRACREVADSWMLCVFALPQPAEFTQGFPRSCRFHEVNVQQAFIQSRSGCYADAATERFPVANADKEKLLFDFVSVAIEAHGGAL